MALAVLVHETTLLTNPSKWLAKAASVSLQRVKAGIQNTVKHRDVFIMMFKEPAALFGKAAVT